MAWTKEKKLAALMRMPWTLQIERNTEEGYLVARIAELPSVVATGEDDRALGVDLWESLEATLSAYLEFDDPIPLPVGSALPDVPSADPGGESIGIELVGDAWAIHRDATASGNVRELSLSGV